MAGKKSTTVDLVNELTARNSKGEYNHMIERAKLGGYHDFKFHMIPGHSEYAEDVCPKMTLVEHLGKFPELSDIRQRVIHGEFDDPADDLDKEVMRQELIADNAPDFMFDQLGLKR